MGYLEENDLTSKMTNEDGSWLKGPGRIRTAMVIAWLAISRLLINRVSWSLPRQCFGGTGVGACWSGAVHDGGSEPRLMTNAAGCELAGITHVVTRRRVYTRRRERPKE